MSDLLQENLPSVLKWLAGILASVAASVAAWTSLGGPVPATQDWVESYVEVREERVNLIVSIEQLDKGLRELSPGPGRTALLEQRGRLCDRLVEVGGPVCRAEPTG